MTTPRWRALSSSERRLSATQRWRFDLAYDGTGLRGFAFQPETTTVVGLIRETLARTLRLEHDPQVVGAGRTDAGVHAFAQVIHVDLPSPLFSTNRGPEAERLVASLNAQMAGRVRILRALPVDDDFHARFSASWRAYRYLVLEDAAPALALSDAWSWAVHGPLDLDLMNAASAQLLGTHDFRAFCRRPSNAKTSEPLLRHVLEATWRRVEDTMAISATGAPALRFDVRAVSFCHNMVRSITSTLVAIGQGREGENTVKERLESLERAFLPPPAPARGLSLVGVGYEAFAGGPSGFVR